MKTQMLIYYRLTKIKKIAAIYVGRAVRCLRDVNYIGVGIQSSLKNETVS